MANDPKTCTSVKVSQQSHKSRRGWRTRWDDRAFGEVAGGCSYPVGFIEFRRASKKYSLELEFGVLSGEGSRFGDLHKIIAKTPGSS